MQTCSENVLQCAKSAIRIEQTGSSIKRRINKIEPYAKKKYCSLLSKVMSFLNLTKGKACPLKKKLCKIIEEPKRDVTEESNPYRDTTDCFLSKLTKPKLTGYERKPLFSPKHNLSQNIVYPVCNEGMELKEKRPKREKFNREKFRNIYKTTLRDRITLGFVEDSISKEEELHMQESIKMNDLRVVMEDVVSSFIDYITNVLMENNKLKNKVSNVDKQLGKEEIHLEKQKAYNSTVQSIYSHCTEHLNQCLHYKNMIYSLTPPNWKRLPDEQGEEDDTARLLEHLETHATGPYFVQIIDLVRNLGTPRIYFKYPWEMAMVFKVHEKQMLKLSAHLSQITLVAKRLKNILQYLKEYYKTEVIDIKEKMEFLESSMLNQKRRCEELEAQAEEITRTIFKDIICGDQVLETYGLVTDTYKCIVPEPLTSLSYGDMMEAIEQEMEDVWLRVNSMEQSEYQKCEKIVLDRIKKQNWHAIMARKKEKIMVQAIKSLRGSYQPHYRNYCRRVHYRSKVLTSERRDTSRKDAIYFREINN